MPDNCSPLKTGTKPHMILPLRSRKVAGSVIQPDPSRIMILLEIW